jgi:hypothetical protein
MTSVPNWSSPVAVLVPHIAALPARIAPERSALLDPLLDEVRFRITDGGKWVFRYLPAEKTVELSRKSIEVIWAACAGYFLTYRAISEGPQPEAPHEIDYEENRPLSNAFDLLAWAMNEMLTERDRDWPTGLLRPLPDEPSESIENSVTQIALCSLAFLLHHELAHHRLSHSESTVEAENDADREAARWVLGDVEATSSAGIFRSWGIAARAYA